MATSVTDMKPLAVDFEQAAKMISLSIHTLRAYERKGLIKATRAGRRVLIPMTELQRILEEGIKTEK